MITYEFVHWWLMFQCGLAVPVDAPVCQHLAEVLSAGWVRQIHQSRPCSGRRAVNKPVQTILVAVTVGVDLLGGGLGSLQGVGGGSERRAPCPEPRGAQPSSRCVRRAHGHLPRREGFEDLRL